MARQTEEEAASLEEVAVAVRDFYERHPYPGPVKTLDESRAGADERRARTCEHHLFWPTEPFRDHRSILIAGCGTAQAARYAQRWPRSRVVGTDISEASLCETQTLKERYGLDNLEIRRLPVEDIEQLEKPSTGSSARASCITCPTPMLASPPCAALWRRAERCI